MITVLTGRCSKTRRPYLMKYERPPAKVSGLAFDLNLNTFNIAGCYPIDEDYFSWSDMAASGVQVNTSELHGVPDARIVETVALSRCALWKPLCIDGPDDVICPWCEKGLSFQDDGGHSDFNVSRGRG